MGIEDMFRNFLKQKKTKKNNERHRMTYVNTGKVAE